MGVTTIPDFTRDTTTPRGTITFTDLFCGGGGSSLGLHHVPGFKVRYAINHDNYAIATHETNFPDTDHEVSDIETVHPSRFARTDCAWFSPSCTAQAFCGPRGSDEESVRSRATMLDVCRWTDYHRYDIVVVENVIEVKLWCDDTSHITWRMVGDKMKPKGCSCGSSYDSWMARMVKMGYTAQEVYFNSQHALVPQSRDRVYIVFSREGIKKPDLDFTPPCWCSSCETAVAGLQTWKRPTKGSARDNERLHQWGRYGTQYLYTCPEKQCRQAAAPAVLGSWAIINPELPIETVGSRKIPLVPATRKRMRVGLQRIGELKPIQVQVGGNLYERPGYARVWSLEDPLRTITTTPYMAAVIPNKTNNIGRSISEPMGTITTSPAAHMLLTMRKGMAGQRVDWPMPSQSTHADQGFLVYNGNPGFVRVLQDAAGVIKTRDCQAYMMVPYNRTAIPHGLEQPCTTIRTHDCAGLLEVTEKDIDDMYFRMLNWTELQRGQAMHMLPDGSPYLLNARVKGKNGKWKDITDTKRVVLVGNAVSSPVATALGWAIHDCLLAA